MRIAFRTFALSAAVGFAGAALAHPPLYAPLPLRADASAGTETAPPVSLGHALPALAVAPTFTGRLQRWLVNPAGRVDGFLLEDGTQVSLPPHLSADLPHAARPGDPVRVQGWRAPGVPVVRAIRLTIGERTVEDAPPAAGGMPHVLPPPGALVPMSASGRVARALYTPRGDLNGVLLDNGGIVRFPPHVGVALATRLRPGSPVFARGWGSRGPQGDALAATALGASAEDARELFAGPGVEPTPGTARPAPRGLRALPMTGHPRGIPPPDGALAPPPS